MALTPEDDGNVLYPHEQHARRCPRCGNRTSDRERETVERVESGFLSLEQLTAVAIWLQDESNLVRKSDWRDGSLTGGLCPACLVFAMAECV